MRCYYVSRYYMNASHSFHGNRETAHSHTFTVVLYIGKRKEQKESDIEVVDCYAEELLSQLEGRYLNELPMFQNTDTSIEDIGNYLYETLKVRFRETNYSLYQLDIADNPLSVYRVADRILLPTLNMDNSKDNYDAIMEQKRIREDDAYDKDIRQETNF
ncbi:MAG: 6-carboxytetrahydropterin synthase [Lachnospiraceae bacterium]|nr:6-carboxytetrahydropterin synthase [Lachnospiraceae bacterium]HCJ09483.1 hypothetical protein [Lachnospiraceae bacterium]